MHWKRWPNFDVFFLLCYLNGTLRIHFWRIPKRYFIWILMFWTTEPVQSTYTLINLFDIEQLLAFLPLNTWQPCNLSITFLVHFQKLSCFFFGIPGRFLFYCIFTCGWCLAYAVRNSLSNSGSLHKSCTSIPVWIENPFQITSENNYTYNYLNFSVFY